jgi:hypothetical protein
LLKSVLPRNALDDEINTHVEHSIWPGYRSDFCFRNSSQATRIIGVKLLVRVSKVYKLGLSLNF